MNYKSKYLKYKLKYLSINGGMGFDVIPQYNLENFQSDLYDNCLNTEAEMEKYISYKKYQKYMEKQKLNFITI